MRTDPKHNLKPIYTEDGSVGIPLSTGEYSWVDAQDADIALRHTWRASMNGATSYAHRSRPVKTPSGRMVYGLHRLILDPPPRFVVDHIDCDGLNNRRYNLRVASQQQNCFNRSSGFVKFKGVSIEKKTSKFRAYLVVNQKQIYLGLFSTAEEAARARDVGARKMHGEFAFLNFPEVQ